MERKVESQDKIYTSTYERLTKIIQNYTTIAHSILLKFRCLRQNMYMRYEYVYEKCINIIQDNPLLFLMYVINNISKNYIEFSVRMLLQMISLLHSNMNNEKINIMYFFLFNITLT